MRKVVWFFLGFIGLVGCGGEVAGPKEPSLVGSWRATAMEYVSRANGSRMQVVALGWGATLTLDEDHSGILAITPANIPVWSWSGTWGVDGDMFRIAGQGADVRLDGRSLHLTGFDHAYDFDGDGSAEPAKMNFVMVR